MSANTPTGQQQPQIAVSSGVAQTSGAGQKRYSIEEIISPTSSSSSGDDDQHSVKNEEESAVEDEEEDESNNGITEGRKKAQEKIASYTEMIARAIFSSEQNMSTLQEIYNFLNSR